MPQLLITPFPSQNGQQTTLPRLYDTNNILSRPIFFARASSFFVMVEENLED